jgi:hypothetical protein
MAFGNLVLGSAISAIVGIVSLLVYVAVYAAFNLDLLTAAQQSMLAVIPTILTAVIVVSVIMVGFGLILGKGK